MNLNDRKRMSELVRSEFRAKREKLDSPITPADIEAESRSILSKNRLSARVEKLEAARDQVKALEKSLSESLQKLGKPKTRRRRYDGCKCHGSYESLLKDLATDSLNQKRDKSATKTKLATEERKLLAKIEVARSLDDLEKVAKAAGLLAG